jgi:hypothetical protein
LLSELSREEIPWAGQDDLISMKVFGASKRVDELKRSRNIADVQKILELHKGPLILSGLQKLHRTSNLLGDSCRCWWKAERGPKRLGLRS